MLPLLVLLCVQIDPTSFSHSFKIDSEISLYANKVTITANCSFTSCTCSWINRVVGKRTIATISVFHCASDYIFYVVAFYVENRVMFLLSRIVVMTMYVCTVCVSNFVYWKLHAHGKTISNTGISKYVVRLFYRISRVVFTLSVDSEKCKTWHKDVWSFLL